jgi:nicotinamidase-related amidase
MAEPVWNKFLTERDKQVFGAAGFATPQGFPKRPAIMVVDMNYAFCGDRAEPILESIKRWPTSCGEDAWEAMKAIRRLLAAAHGKGLPVFYSTGTRRADDWDRGSWAWKSSRTAERPKTAASGLDGSAIVAEIGPQPQDIVIEKQKPSVFHGTPLASFLVLLGADGLIVTGATTSGCVRATVVDAFSSNYRVSLVEEGCCDRSQASHALSLCDMNAKYADIVKLESTLAYIDSLPQGLFDLPRGAAQALRAVR